MRRQAVFRIRLMTGLVLLFTVFLIGRLYYLQVVKHEAYLEEGNRQYVHSVEELYSRGNIFFTSKTGERVSAATVQNGYVLAVNPTQITDAAAVFSQLAPHVSVSRAEFIEQASKPNRTYVEVDNRISQENGKKLAELGIDGVMLFRNRWRFYPGESVAARTIGFVAYSNDTAEEGNLAGRYGLERYYEDVLRRSNERLSVNFFAELFTNLGDVIFNTDTQRSGHVVTTIEPTVANRLQRTLQNTHDAWSSTLTGGIVMNPQTGAIVALDAVPTFNLNDRRHASLADFSNPLVEDVYEMGSIIKPLTVAAGLDVAAITPRSTYFDTGSIEVNGSPISNFDGIGRGEVNMQEVLNQSLNTGVAHIVTTMGKENFREYFYNLKLGSETGIDIPSEAYGNIRNLESPRDIEFVTASFGQGIAMTPIETVRALAALGNGGILVTPHLAEKILYEDGTEKDVRFPQGKRVFSPETSEEISRMLVEVVDSALSGGDVALPRHTIAAKTGTAQIPDLVNGGYYDDRFLHSFFGYFPAFDPQFIVFLYTVEPKDVRYASETLTEPFMDIATFLINYYDIPPDR